MSAARSRRDGLTDERDHHRPERQPLNAAPDRLVRAQIDAIKVYLLTEGLTATEEPMVALGEVFEGLHTLSVQRRGTTRFLRLNYQWLEDHGDHPAAAAAWVQAHGITNDLKAADVAEITIHQAGRMTTRRTDP